MILSKMMSETKIDRVVCSNNTVEVDLPCVHARRVTDNKEKMKQLGMDSDAMTEADSNSEERNTMLFSLSTLLLVNWLQSSIVFLARWILIKKEAYASTFSQSILKTMILNVTSSTVNWFLLIRCHIWNHNPRLYAKFSSNSNRTNSNNSNNLKKIDLRVKLRRPGKLKKRKQISNSLVKNRVLPSMKMSTRRKKATRNN